MLCGEVGDRKPGRKRHLEIEAERGRSLGEEESIVVGRRKGRGAVGGGETVFGALESGEVRDGDLNASINWLTRV